jgi:hypothetical protein
LLRSPALARSFGNPCRIVVCRLVAESDSPIEVLNLSALVRTLTLTVVPLTERDWSEAVMMYRSRRRSLGPGAARFGGCLTAVVAARTGSAVVSEPD